MVFFCAKNMAFFARSSVELAASKSLIKIDDCENFFDHSDFSQTNDFNEADNSPTQVNFAAWVLAASATAFASLKICAFTDP